MEYKVYIIRDLNDVTPVYVGITSGSLRTRLNKHFHDIKRSSCMNKHKKNWISKHRDSKSNIPLRTLNRIVSGDIVYKYIEYKINIMK